MTQDPNTTSAPTRRRGFWRSLVAIASAALTLLCAEIALRASDLPKTARLFTFSADSLHGMIADDPDLFWKLDPNHPDHSHVGLRGPWFEAQRIPSELRILAVGDSCTYGMGVPWAGSWGIQLERHLQDRFPTRLVRAGLVAVPGWSTYQNRRMLEMVVPAVKPNLVVFYCGAWNDHAPAMLAADAELARQQTSLRIGLMVRSVLAPSIDETLAAFSRGETPFGPRVPVAQFRDNLIAMAANCVAGGAEVAFVVPAHSNGTIKLLPGLEEYRAIVRDVASQFRAPAIEMEQVAREVDRDRGAERRVQGRPYDPCFLDRVHPAANLHAALGRELAAAVMREGVSATGESDRAELASLSLDAMSGEIVAPAAKEVGMVVHRAWLGNHFVRDMRIAGGHYRWRVRADAAPGTHLLSVVTDAGLHALGTVEIQPPPIRARLEQQGTASKIVIEGSGEPNRHVWCWLSAHECKPPMPTRYGELQIRLEDLPAPVGGLVRFDLAANARNHTTVSASGAWRIVVDCDPRWIPELARLKAQALVFDLGDWNGAFTNACAIGG